MNEAPVTNPDDLSEDGLTGKILIAMPGMGDPRFEHSVIFMTVYSSDGAMGLIVNKPVPELSLFDLLSQMKLSNQEGGRNLPIHFGGPVERERGFVLHSDDYGSAEAIRVRPGFTMSATQDVLKALSSGQGPADALVALGYAGWGPGQLEAEIAANGWLICEADRDLVFRFGDEDKWSAGLAKLGVSPLTLSSEAGHA